MTASKEYLEHVGPAYVAARENDALRCVVTAGARTRYTEMLRFLSDRISDSRVLRLNSLTVPTRICLLTPFLYFDAAGSKQKENIFII